MVTAAKATFQTTFRIFEAMILLRKIVNTFLALTLLLATTGMTLNKHYCMGRLVSVAVNESAAPCSENGEPVQMPCCEDVSEELKVEEVAQASFDFNATPDLYQLAIVTYFLLDAPLVSVEQGQVKFQNYSPPPPDRDIPVLVQSFLI